MLAIWRRHAELWFIDYLLVEQDLKKVEARHIAAGAQPSQTPMASIKGATPVCNVEEPAEAVAWEVPTTGAGTKKPGEAAPASANPEV